MKKTILSGSTVTGDLTLGNYIGAINNWTKLQDDYDCLYFLANLHALTVFQDPKVLEDRTFSFFAQYLALGLDPKKNIIFVQSHVHEHTELSWILACLTPMGYLNRMTQFKDKSEKHPKNINSGLYTYPVLMAADILLYQADLVPVGEDQRQHLELTRDIVGFWQNRYGEGVFKMPEAYVGKMGARVMSLQEPDKKMSKSDENDKNFISIIDDFKKIEKKIKGAATDSGTEIKYDPENKAGLSNLMTIYSVLSGKTTDQLEKEYEGKMYGHLKVDLADLVVSTLRPVREKYDDLMKNKDYLDQLMKEGADRAAVRAQKTLENVYKNVGILYRR
ncbi:tryptophan--tRNA ligase [Peredibacter starrii]|uniref:Tryptophan--tRNA ligase n=1 Tax=Peredibacter starrii TaxID=28202 RepID=A0AAX4HRU7_9BACT|nr:tryptophan--tRNA ligase [Peredibacter starrii]WPU65922.1 tryptophan--tRNA ligase [Peredibacter starrii]